MGLNDEMEKIRQAGEWLKLPTDSEHRHAAMEHLIHVVEYNDSPSLRAAALKVIDDYMRGSCNGRLRHRNHFPSRRGFDR